MKKPTQQRNSSTDHNPFSICLHTGIPNRINTHKVPGINTGYLPHYPTQKQNKIILTLTKVHNIIPIPSITNIPSINIIIPNTYTPYYTNHIIHNQYIPIHISRYLTGGFGDLGKQGK